MKVKAAAELQQLLARIASQQALLGRLLRDPAGSAADSDLRREAEACLAAGSAAVIPNLHLALSRPAVGVAALLVDKSSTPVRLLIGERLSSHGAGRYACPGGHMEEGESFEACAAREAAEETNVSIPGDASRWRLLTTTNDWMASEGLHYVTIFMTASVTAEERDAVRNMEPDKCVSWEWLTFDEVRRLELFLPMTNFLRSGADALA